MAISHEEVMNSLSPERRARIEALAQDMLDVCLAEQRIAQLEHSWSMEDIENELDLIDYEK